MQRNATIARYLNPWKFRREQEELQRIGELRERDGENCRRCRRPIRFDLPAGHDSAPKIHATAPEVEGEGKGEQPALESLCLVHVRCTAAGADNTAEVKERVQRKSETELITKNRA